MKRFPSNEDVQRCGCAALGNLAPGNSINQEAIGKAGGICVILDAMKRFPSNEEVQHCGSGALWNLASGNPINQEAIGKAGGICVILDAMKRFPSNEEVQHRGSAALANIAKTTRPKQAIYDAGGVDVVLNAMTNFLQVESIQKSSSKLLLELMANTCSAFARRPFQMPTEQQKQVQTRAIHAVVEAMRQHPSIDDIQEYGCKFLGSMAFRDPHAQALIAQAGGLAAIVAALEHSLFCSVRESGCKALSSLGAMHLAADPVKQATSCWKFRPLHVLYRHDGGGKWRCDGATLPGGCKQMGIGTGWGIRWIRARAAAAAAAGMEEMSSHDGARFRCCSCDFDLCARCVQAFTDPLGAVRTLRKCPGNMPMMAHMPAHNAVARHRSALQEEAAPLAPCSVPLPACTDRFTSVDAYQCDPSLDALEAWLAMLWRKS